tara:strand:- start:793 stop:1653 length:861 start_codon:yes stop_codon:yes gene_type:complete
MAYIGNIPATQFASLDYQDLTGVTGSPSKRGFTLNNTVGSANDIEVFVNNVRQEPSVAYTVSGTTLTMTGDVETTDDFYVVFQGKSIGTASHPAGNALEATSGTFTGTLTATAGASTNALSLQSSNFKMTDLTTNAFYRTGTWTPVATGSGATDSTATVFSGTNTEQIGRYERIGDIVHAYFRLTLQVATISYTNNGADTDTLRFTGFPFTVSNISSYYPALSVGDFANWTSWTASYTPMGFMLPATNTASMKYATTNAAGDIQLQYFKNSGASLTASVTYQTDDA